MAISDVDKDYKEKLVLYKQVKAAIEGKQGVVKLINSSAGLLGIPKPQYATQNSMKFSAQAEAYWQRGRYLNATETTLNTLEGFVWSKDAERDLGNLSYLELNADGAGNSLDVVAQRLLASALAYGRGGLLVDMPESAGITIADLDEGINAPHLHFYDAECIKYTRTGVVNGGLKLMEVRLEEKHMEHKEGVDYEEKTYIRRLVLIEDVYTVELYNSNEERVSAVQPRQNGQLMNSIPFFFAGARDNSPAIEKPPLYDLAHVNLGHFVLDCDNRENLHFHGQGSVVVKTDMSPEEFKDANPNGFNVGSRGVNVLGVGDSAELLQLAASGAIPAEMKRDEERLVMLGAQLVTDIKANTTKGAKEIQAGGVTSPLKRIARNVSRCIEKAINECAKFAGQAQDLSYRLNERYVTDTMDAQTLQVTLAAVQGGYLPSSAFNHAARAAGITTLEDDELAEQIEGEQIVGTDEETATLQARIAELEAIIAGDSDE